MSKKAVSISALPQHWTKIATVLEAAAQVRREAGETAEKTGWEFEQQMADEIRLAVFNARVR